MPDSDGGIPAVDIDTFWDIIQTARARSGPGKPLDQALAGYLATFSQQDILHYQERFDQVHGAVYQVDMRAAAYLIGGGCSDDGFTDFRAGLIAQGRDWYHKAAASPDILAGHPAAARAPDPAQDEPLFHEGVSYAASRASEQITGDQDSFLRSWQQARPRPQHADRELAGEDFDFDDDQQMRHRLPRLSALYPALVIDLARANRAPRPARPRPEATPPGGITLSDRERQKEHSPSRRSARRPVLRRGWPCRTQSWAICAPESRPAQA